MSVEYYKKQIVDLRARLDREKEAKKKDNEYYARCIKALLLLPPKRHTANQRLIMRQLMTAI